MNEFSNFYRYFDNNTQLTQKIETRLKPDKITHTSMNVQYLQTKHQIPFLKKRNYRESYFKKANRPNICVLIIQKPVPELSFLIYKKFL